ncbi:MAG: hypothetical protein JWR84_3560 [Caulobacter sp.]|nr:hypothetical protein [Caulobacter sp.]
MKGDNDCADPRQNVDGPDGPALPPPPPPSAAVPLPRASREGGTSVFPFRAAHLKQLTLQPAQAAWRGRIDGEAGAALEASSLAWTLFAGGRVIGCGGVIDRGGGRGEAWALLAQDAGPAMLAATRAVRRYFETAPFRRIEAVTAVDFRPAARWTRLLGFKSEGLMRAYCEDGGAAMRWAFIREDGSWPG